MPPGWRLFHIYACTMTVRLNIDVRRNVSFITVIIHIDVHRHKPALSFLVCSIDRLFLELNLMISIISRHRSVANFVD
jgi:hypothetical protein